MSSNRNQRSLRESLLTALAVGRQMEAALIVASNDSPPREPDRWTARDHLAHIGHYCDYGAAVLDAVRQGVVPPEDAESDIDERNARVLAENRHLAATQVNEWARETYDRLAAAVEQCSQSHLLRPRSVGSDVAVWRVVPGCGWGHVGQHLVYWHLGCDDWSAAELAARRVHDVEMANFDDERFRAGSVYNLGCFYATTGRTAEAVGLVREALTRAPELGDTARHDADLVAIRHLVEPHTGLAHPGGQPASGAPSMSTSTRISGSVRRDPSVPTPSAGTVRW